MRQTVVQMSIKQVLISVFLLGLSTVGWAGSSYFTLEINNQLYSPIMVTTNGVHCIGRDGLKKKDNEDSDFYNHWNQPIGANSSLSHGNHQKSGFYCPGNESTNVQIQVQNLATGQYTTVYNLELYAAVDYWSASWKFTNYNPIQYTLASTTHWDKSHEATQCNKNRDRKS